MIELWQHILYPLLKFPGTLTVVTVLVAFVAWALYKKQRRDHQKDAAGIILREIEDVESQIPKAREYIKEIKDNKISAKVLVLRGDSWGNLQHILASKLPQDVMQSISDFYANSRLLDEALAFIEGVFSKNEQEVRVNNFRAIAQFLDDEIRAQKSNAGNSPAINKSNQALTSKFNEMRTAFESRYPTMTSYLSVKPINDATRYLELVPLDLSRSRVGDKLRRTQKSVFRRIIDTVKV